MSYSISKEFEFSASHSLHGLPDDHPCSRLHGHNYKLRLELVADDVDRIGFVIDYRSLSPFKDWVDHNFDHRHLNDVVSINATAENLSRFLCTVAQGVLDLPETVRCRVHVSETPKTWSVWTPGNWKS